MTVMTSMSQTFFVECKSLVNQIVDQTWSSGLDVYNLYAECAGGISRVRLWF